MHHGAFLQPYMAKQEITPERSPLEGRKGESLIMMLETFLMPFQARAAIWIMTTHIFANVASQEEAGCPLEVVQGCRV